MAISIMVLIISLPSTGQIGDKPKFPSTHDQYEELVSDYKKAETNWQTKNPKSNMEDAGWTKHYATWPIWTFGPRFLQFAREHEKEPESVDALLQIVQMVRTGRTHDIEISKTMRDAVQILIRDHLQNEQVIQTCLPLASRWGYSLEPYARALLASSQNREVLARSCLAVCACNDLRLKIAMRPSFDHADDFSGQTRISGTFVINRLDPDYIQYIRATDPIAVENETDLLMERAFTELGDVPLPPNSVRVRPDIRTIADYLKPKIEARRSLAIGKIAGEIEGEDIDGNMLKLSDYRGKVVVLVFWGSWCAPCMGFLSHEKALVERLNNKPFVLLGVNSDPDRMKLKETVRAHNITWRSWWDAGKTSGPIATRWDVRSWPTIIVIDKAGVIRYKNIRWYAPGPLDEAVDKLLSDTQSTKP